MRHGFTLIQISILLTIASLVLVAVLPSSQSGVQKAGTSDARLTAVLSALRQYQSSTGTLPCPADATQPMASANYGVAASNPGTTSNCSGGTPSANYVDSSNKVAIGMVPVRALNLSNDYALDNFGRVITYAVDTNATACWVSTLLPGQIVVTDNGSSANSIAALVSHGADGHGAWIPLPGSSGTAVRLNAASQDTDQLTNAHVDANFNPTTILTNFVRKPSTATFDDIVVYKSNLWTLNSLPIVVPRITSVVPPANGNYTAGQVLTFSVTYSGPVTVTTTGGTPYLSLSAITGNVGTGNVARATYQSGSGSSTLTFSYTVAANDIALRGLTMASGVTLNGGTIMSGGACAATGLTAPDLSHVIIGPMSYIADYGNNVVRKVSGGVITTLTSASGPFGVAADGSGNVYIAASESNKILKVTSGGTVSVLAGTGAQGYSGDGGQAGNATFYLPFGVAVDSSGNVYVVDTYNNVIRKISAATGVITTVAGSQYAGGSCRYTGDGSAATSATLCSPVNVAVDASGNLYIADSGNNVIRKVTVATGKIATIAGTGSYSYPVLGGPATSSPLADPRAVSVDSSGRVYIADTDVDQILVVSTAGIISNFAGAGSNQSYSGDGGAATNANFYLPMGLAVDSSGNVYIADTYNNVVREVVSSTGIISTVAGSYYTGSCQYSGDGAAATSAKICVPTGVAVPPSR